MTDRFCSSCLWSIIQMHISISKQWSQSQKRNLWIFDFINLLIWVRELVPYRKAVLQASPISRSMCKNYESHHASSITNVPNSHKGNWDRTWFGLNGQIHRPPSTEMAWTCQPHALWSFAQTSAIFLASTQETKGCPGDDLWQDNDQSIENL